MSITDESWKIKVIIGVVAVVLIALVGLGIKSCSYVEPGFVGVKVNKLGSDKGVDAEVLVPGQYWLNPFTEVLYTFPTFQQTKSFTKDEREGSPENESFDFQTKEGLSINSDIGLSFHVDPSKAHILFAKYRKGIEQIISVEMRNAIRNAFNIEASKVDVESAYGPGKEALLLSVQKRVQDSFDSIGIIVDRLYLINNFRLPPNVVAALDLKIKAKQDASRIEVEVLQRKAEAEKQIVDARADSLALVIRTAAEVNLIKMKSEVISTLVIEYDKVQKWDGILPNVTGGSIPMINVTK